jgi:release factor glutamine methyltransferase
VIVDLCCGSGALSAAMKAALPQAEVYASDLSPDAVTCARTNLAALGVPADHIVEGDLLRPLPAHIRGDVDVLLANVPYVPTAAIATMPPEAREHEPRTALDGGTDGLDVLRRLAADASAWLAPRGELLTECAPTQAEAACAILAAAGLGPTVHRDPERGATVVIARANVGSC